MIDVLSAEDVHRQDDAAVAAGIPIEQLMENAGWGVARVAREMMGGTYGRRVVVVCGKGNNAGDGLVAGRLLHEQGAHVTAVLTLDPLNELSSLNLIRFPGRVVRVEELPRELARADLVIDAIFGVGLTRAPEGAAAEAIEMMSRASRVLSVDVPSGMDADTGLVKDPAVRAEVTVSLSGFKPGLLFNPERAGRVLVAGIGAPSADVRTWVLDAGDVASELRTRISAKHKRSAGTVLLIAGSRAMPGAAALAAAAAVHAGAGLTTLCAPEDVCRIVLAIVPEITTIPVPETGEGTIGIKAMDLIRPKLERFTGIGIGPGLSTHPGTVEFVHALLSEASQPVVLDADGLNAVVDATDLLRDREFNTVITPHTGELSRLSGLPAEELETDRLRHARRLAVELRSVVVFKGPGSVIASQLETYVNPTGSSALAQGGTGDVLTGILSALVSRRADAISPRTLAAGVWLHGYAADRLAARISPHTANASALIDELGPAMHEVCS